MVDYNNYWAVKHWKFFFGTSVPIVIIGIVSSFYIMKSNEKEYSKYKPVKKNTIVNGYIKKVTRVTSNSLLDLKSGNKYWLNIAWNYDYEPSALCEFIQMNDSISKEADNDTILIFRSGNKYIFKLNESLNNRKP
jgi:hypothetical protein